MASWLELLKNPPAAYRAAPFWAWNGDLKKAELVRQVSEMARGGMGGFFMHVRYGLENEYLSPEFMELVKAVVETAEKKKMEAWLYDEDRWPSGFAGGLVTSNPDYRIKALVLEEKPASKVRLVPEDAVACFSAVVEGGKAHDVRLLKPGSKPPVPRGRTVLIYRRAIGDNTGWFNNAAYLDTMNPRAVREFIKVTHEAYKKTVGRHFGKTIPGIFTDEPNFGQFFRGGNKGVRHWPWTDRLLDEFKRRFGYDLRNHLVEISHDVEGIAVSKARYNYRRLTTELYVEAFSKQIGKWCGANKLELTGHELAEESLSAQTDQVGACMPHYEYFQRPGIDILMDRTPEVLTAKQAVSVATQLGRNRVLSELYGCTGWDTTFEAYKHIGDWHQVLGVNHFCPHLSWYQMKGGAKRDYPASIFYQSAWWTDFRMVNDYFGRLSLALSQGAAVRETAVLHPIESAWLVHRKEDKRRSSALSESLERLCNELLDAQFDFDFLDESLLPKYAAVEKEKAKKGKGVSSRLRVGKAAYRAVVVPEAVTLRASTVGLLEKFSQAGGKVIFVGSPPTLEDCKTSPRLRKLVEKSLRVPVGAQGLEAALGGKLHPVIVQQAYGGHRNQLKAWIHLRNTKEGEVLFVHHRDRLAARKVNILWQGNGRIREVDLKTGKISDVPGVERRGARQVFEVELHPTDGRLYLRTKERVKSKPKPPAPVEVERLSLAPRWNYELEEPNTLNLDYCRVRMPKERGELGRWSERDLIWRQERRVRRHLGFRDNARPAEQPYIWMRNLSKKSARVEIEFSVTVEEIPKGPLSLVMEHPENFHLAVNGRPVPTKATGFFIDRSFKVVPLTGVKIKKGVNTVRLSTEYREHHWLEEVYLLGRFGVRVSGAKAIVGALPKKLAVGDWCAQGLAMYSGAVAYTQTVRVPKSFAGRRNVLLCLDRPKATTIRVAVNGKAVGKLGWPPWKINVAGYLRPGQTNEVTVTPVAGRRNLLGPLHHVLKNPPWTGSGEFRTEGKLFTPAYNLVPYGLLGEAYLSVQE